MDDTEEILSIVRIDSGLSADRAIHHCKQGRRNLDVRNTAMINRRDESGDVADHSAAETDYERQPIQSCGNHLLADHAGLLERLRFLACWNRDQHRF